uniref:Uncharacterized protein n=1 Tax=Oryza barthii TaxID=65489 RepID=A0A0D3F606_9ORYZ
MMSGSVPLDATRKHKYPWEGAILGVFKRDKINCSPLPTHPILQWMVNDLLIIFVMLVALAALIEGDATGDELVAMMGLARELTATQRARAMT